MHRTGFILGREQLDGSWRFAEAAPIPSFHQINEQQLFAELSAFMCHQQPPVHPLSQWAVQQLDIPQTPIEININSLADQHSELNDLGQHRCLKLKVGRQELSADQKMIRTILQRWPELTLRLDANRLWTTEQALKFFDWAQGLPIEYIEDPIANDDHLDRLQGIAIALDELLRPDLIQLPCVRAVIIKPSLWGASVQDLIAEANKQQKQVILSSAFESSIGLSRIAALLPESQDHHGLGTISWFKDHVVNDPARIIADRLRFPWTNLSPEHLDYRHLRLELQR